LRPDELADPLVLSTHVHDQPGHDSGGELLHLFFVKSFLFDSLCKLPDFLPESGMDGSVLLQARIADLPLQCFFIVKVDNHILLHELQRGLNLVQPFFPGSFFLHSTDEAGHPVEKLMVLGIDQL